MRTLIGIDIGWSEKRASCGVAVRGPLLLDGKAIEYPNGVRAVALTHRKLLALLETWRGNLAGAAIVVDGPLAPEGVPRRNRRVDAACGMGDFRGRCQPYPVEGAISEPFLQATDAVLEALGRPVHWLGGPLPEAPFAVEANPTVALALWMPRISIERLSSRNKPLVWRGRRVTAKSDWYWRHGGHRHAAAALDSDFSAETDHERCAALVCLALASLIVQDRALALGDATGIYAAPADIDATWSQSLTGLVHHGRPVFRDHLPGCSSYWKEMPELDLFADAGQPEPAEEPALILADSGGVWTQHNPWLAEAESPVFLRALDLPACPTIILHRSARDANQWTIAPSALTIARMRGIDGPLSLRTPVELRIQLLDGPKF